GGVVYVKLSFSTWADWEMDEAELIVAQQIEHEYGVRAQVKILSEEEQESILSMGYGTPFLFSSSTEEGSTDYYTLDAERPQLTDAEVLISGPEQHEREGKALLSLDKLFSPCIINTAAVPRSDEIHSTELTNFAYQPLLDLFDPRVPSPPPAAVQVHLA
ncbi:MAG: hypothetical protein KDD15_00420, partial [Lewinella sp.]|nr:hypothetical protein [Lewinella sp.]